jgi:polysaccharide export outer membrane protein
LVSGEERFNVPLLPKDIIYVRPEEMVTIYVTGQIRNPGALQVPKTKIPTLYRAIIQAGGFADRAAKGGVTIKRMNEDGEEVIIKVNVKDIEKNNIKDVHLQEGDIVIVPESLF